MFIYIPFALPMTIAAHQPCTIFGLLGSFTQSYGLQQPTETAWAYATLKILHTELFDALRLGVLPLAGKGPTDFIPMSEVLRQGAFRTVLPELWSP